MSSYINIHSLAYPYHEGDIRLLHPEIREDQTGDTFPCPPEFAPVKEKPFPEFDPNTHKVERTMPFNIDGVWEYTFNVVELTSDEIANRQAILAKIKQMEEDKNAQANSNP